MLGVQLPTCVSSPVQSTNVRLEFSPTVPQSVLFCFWVGQTCLKLRTVLRTEALCLFLVHVAVNIHSLIGLADDSSFLTSASTGFGAGFWTSCVYDDILERSFVSLRDGDQPDLTPLGDSPLLSPSLASASSSLRSTYEAWKAGTLTKAALVDIAPSDSIAAYFSAPHSSSLGSSSRSCLYTLWKVSPPSSVVFRTALLLALLPRLRLFSSLRARSRSPCRIKRPLVLLRPRGDVSPAVTGAPPGSLSARCVVFTVSPCLIIFSLFSVL